MKELSLLELANYFQVSVSTIKTNFPKFKSKQLSKGYLITKRGKGDTAIYEIEKVKPQNISSEQLSSVKKDYWTEDLPGEIWITAYYDSDFEVSNFARVRNKKDLTLRKISQRSKNGYFKVSMNNQNYAIHRLVLLSFNPITNPDDYTVDHIDGNRSNNNLSNLRWVSNEENISFMMTHRKELNKELTRLLQNYSYLELLDILKNIQ